MQATSPFSDTRISIFQNISTSLPFHGSPTVPKNPWRFATANPPPGRLQHHQGTGNAEIFILTRLHGMKPWPILLRSLSSDTTFASGRCISDMDPVLRGPVWTPTWVSPLRRDGFWWFAEFGLFFFANRSCFSTTQLDSIQSSRFSFHPFSHVLSQKGVCLKSSYPSSPEWVQDQPPSKLPHPALPNLRIPGSHPGFLNHFL